MAASRLDLSSEPWIDNIAQAARDTYTTDGKVYGAAVASWGGGILYNQDLLAEVGATEPPATWDEFLDLCKDLKDAGITPIYEGGSGISIAFAALLGLENEALGGDMDAQIWAGETTFEETWTDPLTEWYRLFTEDIVPTSVTGLSGDQITSEFQNGQVAMITTGSWALGSVQSGAPDMKLGFWPVSGASGPYWAGAVSPGYAINAQSAHPEAAATFVEFLQSAEGVELLPADEPGDHHDGRLRTDARSRPGSDGSGCPRRTLLPAPGLVDLGLGCAQQ